MSLAVISSNFGRRSIAARLHLVAVMDIVSLAILVIVIVAVVAIVIWYVRRSGIVIPEPLMLALWAIIAILAILFVASLAGIGPMNIRWRAN